LFAFFFSPSNIKAGVLFKLLSKYRPEDRASKKKRLLAIAKERAEKAKASKGKKAADAPKEAPAATKKPNFVKYGINHVTALVEQKQAKLVVIAHDVDPIEVCIFSR